MEFLEQWNYYNTMTEGVLNVMLDQSDAPDILYESMKYSLFAGGKRLRPMLCLSTCELLGEDPTEALKAACAIEMIHTYSLIHDDLPCMDNDDMRRGKPSNHKVFGEGNAVLAGDGLLSLAAILLSQISNQKVFQSVARGAMDMVSGQSMDLNGQMDAETLFSIHEKKTGALIKAAILSGAYTANPTPKQVSALTDFAEQYGMLFQITDDILDVESTTEKMGKTVGKDERDGKLTFVTLYGIDGAKSEAQRCAKIALDALAALDLDSGFLEELVTFTIDRQV